MEAPHPHAKDSKYKQYVSAVDKALKAFESTNEWADLIAALGKLAKVFSAHAKYQDIPKPVTVAKRLSQCLHPLLPHGVHLKALETYKQIFDILGPDALAKQLYLFAVGLFPLMDHCGIKVKGELLSIFEQYLVPLGERLRPSLPGFLTGVLLGLEEGTEFFDRSFSLLDNVCSKVGSVSFYACLWQSVMGSPSVRLPALIYVNAKFDKQRSIDEQMHMIGDDVEHMVAALCAAGEDTGSALVQRNLLDFLCSAFALDSTAISRGHFVQLLRRSLFVVLRRDMSLNRRLFTWILNPTGVSTAVSSVPVGDDKLDTSFFIQTSLPMIVDALAEFLDLDIVEIPIASSAFPFAASSSANATKEADTQHFVEVRISRLLTYLQDRPEVGRPVLMRVLPMLLMKCAELLEEDPAMDEDEESIHGTRQESPRKSFCDRGGLSLRFSTFSIGSEAAQVEGEKGEDAQKALARRREEVGKNLNVLMQAVDDEGFLWEFLGDWYKRLLSTVEGSPVEAEEGRKETRFLPVPSAAEAQRHLKLFPRVVAYSLSVSQLNATASVRGRFLPRLLRRVLASAATLTLSESHTQMLLATLSIAWRLLKEMERGGASASGEDLRSDTESTIPVSPSKAVIDELQTLFDEKEQCLVEGCLEESLRLLTSICNYYCATRTTSRWPILRGCCSLLTLFAEFPLYCTSGASQKYTDRSSRPLPDWVNAMLQVIDIDSWERDIQSTSSFDFEPRATCLEVLTRLCIRSASVVAQHSAIGDRNGMSSCQSSSTTVLLVPLLRESHLRALEDTDIFDRSGKAAWAGAGAEWPRHQAHAAQLVLLLHSRKPSEPSSSVEQAIVTALTNPDTVVSTEAARTFHRIWTLTRSNEDIPPGIPMKPFNRVVMLLLGVLADDSVSFEKVELRSVATAWFVDCARHNDLPNIIQMLAMMLMNPATARVSIQYVKQEAKLSPSEMASLPPSASAVTLLTADKQQRLHHLVHDDNHGGQPSWMAELRGRLLSTNEDKADHLFPLDEPPRHTGDVPCFDEEETDSLDTLSLSLETIDPVVVETLQYIIDCVVDEEESELDARRRFDEAMGRGRPLPSSSSSTSVSTATRMTEEEIAMAEKAARMAAAVAAGTAPLPPPGPSCPPSSLPPIPPLPPFPPLPDGVARIKKGHRRQDSLAETIFSMTNADLRLFDQSEPKAVPSSTSQKEVGGTVTSSSSTESREGTTGWSGSKSLLYHELHAHMLLYSESGRVVDLGRAETGFRILTALLRPRGAPVPASILLNCLVSSVATCTSRSADDSSTSPSLTDLMSRHVRAILGQQFWSNVKETADTEESRTRNLTLLELLITISLHFLRSYFVNSPIAPVTFSDLVMSWKCKIAVLELLTELLRELASMALSQQSLVFVNFVQAILARSKLQKCLLLLLVQSVHDPRRNMSDASNIPLSMLVAEFNEGRRSLPGERNGEMKTRTRLSGLVAAYNRALLAFTAANIRLEYELKIGSATFSESGSLRSSFSSGGIMNMYGSPVSTAASMAWTVGKAASRESPSLVELKVFLLTVLNGLKRCPDRHEGWLQLVVHILPWMDRALPKFCMRVTEQLCKNMETAMVAAYPGARAGTLTQRSGDVSVEGGSPFLPSPDDVTASGVELGTEFPANFLVMTLETLTTLLHFCVVDTSGESSVTSPSTPQSSAPSAPHSTPLGSTSLVGQALAAVPGTRGAGELFSNFVKVFSFGESNSHVPRQLEQRTTGSAWKQARAELLAGLPHALATICDVWSVVQSGKMPLKAVGTPHQLRRLVLELVAPMAQLHRQQFLSSLALVWLTRGDNAERDSDKPDFNYSEAQLHMTSLLLDIQVIPLDKLVSAISVVLKESGTKGMGTGGKGTTTGYQAPSFPTETPLLELLHGCVGRMGREDLGRACPSLLSLMADAPLHSLPSRAVFLLFIILCDYVRECSPCGADEKDKNTVKQVQEATHRLVEACNSIVGWQLEQTTWLKRTLVVKQETGAATRSTESTPSIESAPLPSLAASDPSQRASTISLLSNKPPSQDNASVQLSLKSSASNLRASLKESVKKREPAESTRALFLLADNLADLVDCVCRSDEKERLLPVLHAVWANVVPYLKAKNARNSRFFLASSQLLASMSSYSYMRPVWRKTTMELLLDPTFFKMDMQSLRQWLVVTDHLMTHDKNSFRDLLRSISSTPNASFSIMGSKEAEYEARTQSLKRLAFIVLGSELDQYRVQLPDIQERLAENLRMCQAVPSIRAAVFLCYRVLLLRLNPTSLVSQWPAMVTELVHVLLQVEQQLAGEWDSEDLASAKDDQWMQLYLAACKLLESLCTLPAGYLSQFQMCHWAFVSTVSPGAGASDVFVPFAGRINSLLEIKFGRLSMEEMATSSASLANVKTLTGFEELRPFFFALAKGAVAGQRPLRDASLLSGSLSHRAAIQRLQHALYVDFAEHWQL